MRGFSTKILFFWPKNSKKCKFHEKILTSAKNHVTYDAIYMIFFKVLILPYILANFEVNWIIIADFRQVG